MLVVNALLAQALVEEAEQVRLPAAADARNHLDRAVVHAVNEPVEVSVAPDFHVYLILIPR